jgi:hypothetical protein
VLVWYGTAIEIVGTKGRCRHIKVDFVQRLVSETLAACQSRVRLAGIVVRVRFRRSQRRWANNVELAYTPTYSSWFDRIEAQLGALRYFTLDGTEHGSHREQASMICRHIIWRNRNAHDRALRDYVNRANVA